MDYKERYDEALGRAKALYAKGAPDSLHLEEIFPELKESEDEKIRKGIIEYLEQSQFGEEHYLIDDDIVRDYIAWLEKQCEQTNPYSGISFEHNGHIWGMCARDNGVDILLDKQLFKHLARQDEQKPAWSEEDEQQMKSCLDFLDNISCGDDSELNDCRNWLKSIKQRMKGE